MGVPPPDTPLVSIGMPVYNGENYITEAIESVLDQTYTHFELIISDNASNDKTDEICKAYLNKDKRIRYHRFSQNMGAAKNYNNTFEMSSGKYFRWLAHDDKLMPDNIAESVAVLEKNNDGSICTCAKEHIDNEGHIIAESTAYGFKDRKYKKLNILDDDPVIRYHQLLSCFSISFSNADFIMGLIRSDVLRRTNLIGNYTSSDFNLLAELVLNGKFYILEDALFQRRIHHGVSTSVYNNQPDKIKQLTKSDAIPLQSHVQIAKWFDPNAKVRRIPHFKWLNELIKGFQKLNWTLEEKIKLYWYSYRWFFSRVSHALKVKFRERVSNRFIYDK